MSKSEIRIHEENLSMGITVTADHCRYCDIIRIRYGASVIPLYFIVRIRDRFAVIPLYCNSNHCFYCYVFYKKESEPANIHIAVGIILVLCLIGVAGYCMIPRAGYTEVSDGYMLQHYNQGFSLDGQAVIPSQYNGKPVVAIDSGAFKGDLFLKSVTLPDTIVRIGGEAFKNCRRLERINIPDGVVELRGNTFEGCSSLKYMEIPDSVVAIHVECFRKCKKLTGIHLSSNITEIKGNTFEDCTSLQSIEIPNGVTRIAGHAFYGCNSLSEVTVPATVESIDSSAFRQCNSLYEIALPNGVSINERSFKESPTTLYFYVRLINCQSIYRFPGEIS